jgi:hypothetical protein
MDPYLNMIVGLIPNSMVHERLETTHRLLAQRQTQVAQELAHLQELINPILTEFETFEAYAQGIIEDMHVDLRKYPLPKHDYVQEIK